MNIREMNAHRVDQTLAGSFTPGERAFLFGDNDFRKAMSIGSDDPAGVRFLNQVGLRVLVAAGYVPSHKARKAPR